MNRYGKQFRTSIETAVWDIFGTVTFDVNGDGVTTGLGVSGISHSAPGIYTLALTGPFNKLLGLEWIFGTQASGIDDIELTQSLAAQSTDIQAGLINIATLLNGTPADPASGSTLLFTVTARNSSVGG